MSSSKKPGCQGFFEVAFYTIIVVGFTLLALRAFPTVVGPVLVIASVVLVILMVLYWGFTAIYKKLTGVARAKKKNDQLETYDDPMEERVFYNNEKGSKRR